MSGSSEGRAIDPSQQNPDSQTASSEWDEAFAAMELNPALNPKLDNPKLDNPKLDNAPLSPASSHSNSVQPQQTIAQDRHHSPQLSPHALNPQVANAPPIALVETAFLASTTVLLWMVGYYLNLSPWLRILYPIPIALVFLRWQARAAWMTAIVATLLLAVLMGPVLSLLFLFPTGFIGVHLGFMWRRRSPWVASIATASIMSILGTFFRLGLLSLYLGEDLWVYTNNRIADIFQWLLDLLVGWGILGISALGQTNPIAVQIIMVLVLLTADLIYLFTVHLAAWLLLDRLGNPIPEPPRWVQVLLEEEK